MEYIGIIIMIIGFLFSLLEKDKKNKEKKQKQLARKSPTKTQENTGNKTIRPQAREQVVATSNIDSSLSELEQLKRQNASLQKKLKILERQQVINKATKFEKTANPKEESFFTKENIVDAVVFSEVLSAPRARVPHRTYKRSR